MFLQLNYIFNVMLEQKHPFKVVYHIFIVVQTRILIQ